MAGFGRVLTVFPRRSRASTVLHFNAGPGNHPRGVIDGCLGARSGLGCRSFSRGFGGGIHVGNPAQEWGEVGHIGDVPNFFGAIPAGSEFLCCLFFGKGRN